VLKNISFKNTKNILLKNISVKQSPKNKYPENIDKMSHNTILGLHEAQNVLFSTSFSI